MTRPVADQMVETLAAPGIERIYGILGDSLNGFTDALRRHGGFELRALIEALVQRAVDTPETKLHVGPLELDLIERTAKRGDRTIDLLSREFRLLEYMMRHKGRVLTREMLLREVWKYRFVPKSIAFPLGRSIPSSGQWQNVGLTYCFYLALQNASASTVLGTTNHQSDSAEAFSFLFKHLRSPILVIVT
jgi:hypothetical protein